MEWLISLTPGLAHDPISRMSFKDYTFDPDTVPHDPTAIPWTKLLLRQRGVDVQPLPFTISPFAVIEAAQKWLPRLAEVSEDFMVDTMSMHSPFVSACTCL